jgi:hypothetical protein
MRDIRIPWVTAVSAAVALLLTLAAAPGIARAAAPPDGWAITLTATLPGFPERGQLTLGASSPANDGADGYDTPRPPLFPQAYLDLYTEHSRTEAGWGAQAAPTLQYGAEYQSPLGTAERAISFLMATDRTGPVTLAWTGVGGAELDKYNVVLEDGATGEQIDLRAESSHTISAAPGARSLWLRLVPGRGDPTPPLLVTPPDQVATEGASAGFDLGSFTDSGADGPWAADVDWGDGTAHTALGAAAPGPLPPQAHTYAAAGTYRVTLTVTDKDGATGAAGFTVAVAPAGQCQPFTWLTPPDGAVPYDLPVNSRLTLRFRWGDCTRFIHDESVIVQVENPDDPNLPITTWVYGFDIIIDDAAEEYRADFTPSLYGLSTGADLPVTVYIGDQLVGQAMLHLTQ